MTIDVEFEVARLVTDPQAMDIFYRHGITTEHFADNRCRDIFYFSMDYFIQYGRMRNAPTDEIVRSHFPEYDSLIVNTQGAEPAYLAQQLKQLYVRRAVIYSCKDLSSNLSQDPLKTAMQLREELSAITDKCIPREQLIVYGENLDAYRKLVAERKARIGFPYPFPFFQGWTGGIKPGEICTLIAPAAFGKSNCACRMALEGIRNHWNVYFASLELDPLAITERIEYMEVNKDGLVVPIARYTQGDYKPEYEVAIEQARMSIISYPGKLVIEQPQIEDRTPTKLVQTCKAKNCNMLIVDQLQFVKLPKRDTLSERVGAAMQEFKQQIMTPADNFKLPMLLLHQMNRAGIEEMRKKSGHYGSMEYISHSAWVEQISDTVIGMGCSREEANNDIMNWGTLKARNFKPLAIRLDWDMTDRFYMGEAKDEVGNVIRLDT